MVGISRQAHHQRLASLAQQELRDQALLSSTARIRKDHPRLGARKVYDMLSPPNIGRDAFEALLLSNGYRLLRKRNYQRTTYSCLPSQVHPNRISGMEVTAPRQLWVSDITYLQQAAKCYYLVLIMDVYTRRIVGWQVSDHLKASANVAALDQAIAYNKGEDLTQLIHHSDRGSQYIASQYLDRLRDKGIAVSMGNKAWENAHAERINGILKQEYMEEVNFENLKQVKRQIKRIIKLYNEKRPHLGLPGRLSPAKFENSLRGVPPEGKPPYTVTIKY